MSREIEAGTALRRFGVRPALDAEMLSVDLHATPYADKTTDFCDRNQNYSNPIQLWATHATKNSPEQANAIRIDRQNHIFGAFSSLLLQLANKESQIVSRDTKERLSYGGGVNLNK